MFDQLTEAEDRFDKASDEHISIKKEKEHIAKSFINIKNQVDKLKQGTVGFKGDLQEMSKGTPDSAHFTNSAIYGNQWDEMHIDKDGNFNFLIGPNDLVGPKMGTAKKNFAETGVWEEKNAGVIRLNDMDKNAIIKEPYGAKAFVFKLAERTKVEKDSGKAFDENWTYNRTLNNFTESGPNATIGIAFADLAGDGQTKSFAEMYEEGMKEEYYIHPDTGEALPEGLLWMKDPANADVLSKMLAKYVTNVMKDMYGPTINEDTGQVEKTQSQVVEELIKKYRK